MSGTKHDNGKPMMGLISGAFLTGLATVLTFGAKKYAAHNWRKGLAYSRVYDALQRHLVAYWAGEDMDPETGLSHLDHAACELMFLREFSETRKDLDDRYKKEAPALPASRPDMAAVTEDLKEAAKVEPKVLQVKAGAYYRRRDGKTVGPIKDREWPLSGLPSLPMLSHPFKCPDGLWYRANGAHTLLLDQPEDLVEEVV